MAANRLQLDFSLDYSDERSQFLDTYLQQDQFIKRPPTSDELETMANYLLWGKDRNTGLNAKQDGSVTLSTRYGDWDNNQKCESLDALMESPTFNENQLRSMDSVGTRVKREVFSRSAALRDCPDSIRPEFESLFRQIDETELQLNYYDLRHNKRIKPPREELVAKFSEQEQLDMQEAITHWNQFFYLKQRHKLIDLRRQQYTLRDCFVHPIQPLSYDYFVREEKIDFDAGIEVLPLGLWADGQTSGLLFRDWNKLNPEEYSEQELKVISDRYWKKKHFVPSAQQTWIDFRELEHVYAIFQEFYDLDGNARDSELWENNTKFLMRTLKFYVDAADLTDVQRDILNMKLEKKRNIDIVKEVNAKWNKTYTPNYISTIFRQRIIPKINKAAEYHEQVIGNIFFPEEFKRCTCCGRVLLKDPINFTRKTRSKDGFTTRCKQCEKAARNAAKENKHE